MIDFEFMGITPDNFNVGDDFYYFFNNRVTKFTSVAFMETDDGKYCVIHNGGSSVASRCFPVDKINEFKAYANDRMVNHLKETVIPDYERRIEEKRKMVEDIENGTLDAFDVVDETDGGEI